MAEITGGELLARCLAGEGIRFVFGLPCPEIVVATAISRAVANFSRSASPPARTTPPPQITTGNRADRMASRAASTAAGSALTG